MFTPAKLTKNDQQVLVGYRLQITKRLPYNIRRLEAFHREPAGRPVDLEGNGSRRSST